jgi:hypothetical protein
VSYGIRPATVADIPELVTLRRTLLEAMGYTDADALDPDLPEMRRTVEQTSTAKEASGTCSSS